MSKTAPRILIAMLSAGLLLSQSLVEVSKAEQERREKLKGKNVKVITNADLQSVRKTPAVTMTSVEAGKDQTGAGEPAVTSEEQEAPPIGEKELRVRSDVETEISFARQVLPESILVQNPEYALNFHDGRYAEISILGLLDLDFSARNGTGDDIAIYARNAGGQEGTTADPDEGVLAGALEGSWPGGFWYGVLVMDESGDWEAIGQGTGVSSPEKFDLGRFQSIRKIRIMFRPHNTPVIPVKFNRIYANEKTIGIDAVEALH